MKGSTVVLVDANIAMALAGNLAYFQLRNANEGDATAQLTRSFQLIADVLYDTTRLRQADVRELVTNHVATLLRPSYDLMKAAMQLVQPDDQRGFIDAWAIVLRRAPDGRYVAFVDVVAAKLNSFDPVAAYDREGNQAPERPLMQVIVRNGRVFGVNRSYLVAEWLDLRGVSGKVPGLYERLGNRLQGGEQAGGKNRSCEVENLPTPDEAFVAINQFLLDLDQARATTGPILLG